MKDKTDDITDSRALCIDPLHGCAPIGALYASFGIHATLPLSHGSSGCCRFQRMEISKHFQKKIHMPSSMLRDRAAMFGGEPELREAVENVFRLYDPEMIVICTTCLSETIGDDMGGIVARLDVPSGKKVVWASTPGYAGSPLLGYAAVVSAIIRQTANEAASVKVDGGAKNLEGASSDTSSDYRTEAKSKTGTLCVLPGWMNPVDIDIACSYADAFFDDMTVLPDTRGVFDERTPDGPKDYNLGGTPQTRIAGLASCSAAIAFGREATHRSMHAFEEMTNVAKEASRETMLPVGVRATDMFIQALTDVSGRAVPRWIVQERSQAVDCIMQLANRLYGKRAVIACDSDMALGMASFLMDVGMVPVCIAVGEVGVDFEEELRGMTSLPDRCAVLRDNDRFAIEEWAIDHTCDIVVGDTRNKRLAARLGVPLIRVGFPVVDRPLAYTAPVSGYRGTVDLLRRIADAFCTIEEEGRAPEDLMIARHF